jgi:hypothetical protein
VRPAGCQAADTAAKAKAEAEAETTAKAALNAGVEAVVYGLPLVIMDITRQKISNVAKPGAFVAPVNQFAHARAFPDSSFASPTSRRKSPWTRAST